MMALGALNSGLLALPRSPISIADNHRPAAHSLPLSLLDHCTNFNHLQQLHAHILRSGQFFDPYSASKLFKVAALSPFSTLDYALKVFDQIPHPNIFAWNTLIRAFASSERPIEGLFVFNRMLLESPHFPNKFTFPFLIKAASAVNRLPLCQSLHGMVIKASLGLDLYILNSLVYCYASCGDLDSAYFVFLNVEEKDVVSWNSMIAGFVQAGYPEKALALFEQMELENVRPNDVTMVAVLSACAKKMDLEFGRRICQYIERNALNMNINVSNAMLDMYVKNGSIEDARRLFDEMAKKDKFSWTTMVDGYAKIGDFEAARAVFYSMPEQDISTWNVLISAYEQDGKPKEALAVFHELQQSKTAKPDEVTLVSILSACAQLGAIDIGSWIHVYIKKQKIKLNCHLYTSLIDMYSKCGDLEKALEVFNSADRRDVFVWSAMIAGLAMHGRGRDSIDLFAKMLEAGINPNSVTFTNLLCACSHAGLVEEGEMYFNQMESVYGVLPGSKHYACMVDILGRAGFLKEAVELIEKMPIAPTPSVWGALLGACRIHGNLELAEKAARHLLEIDPTNDGAYVLLSNIYAKTGKWENVSGLRQHMKESGIKKEAGCSSIEVDGAIHEFLAGDNSHPFSNQIYRKLNEMVAKLKSVGYNPNESHLLQYVEEEDMKERALSLHSENPLIYL